jgi:hypothetical protein
MPTQNEIDAAVKLVSDFAGNPVIGPVKELLEELSRSLDNVAVSDNVVAEADVVTPDEIPEVELPASQISDSKSKA